jgi:Tfp pilus assembly protein PilF
MERIARLKEFLLSDPRDLFVKHALALEYIKLGEETAARSLFEEILEQDPAYIGSYYHLAKLLERTGETQQAISWYEKGMAAAKAAGEKRAYNELQAAHDDLLDE